MRKLKLQVQITLDGFIADPEGKTDWAVWNWAQEWNWDKALQEIHIGLNTSSDCILLSSKFLGGGFLEHWKSFNDKPNDPQYPFAKAITDMRKVVFSNSATGSEWENVEIVSGDLTGQVLKLKREPGKDIIAYGGARFVTALLEHSLIDEIYLFINPVAIGKGLTIFDHQGSKAAFKLEWSQGFDCGVVVSKYLPQTPAI